MAHIRRLTISFLYLLWGLSAFAQKSHQDPVSISFQAENITANDVIKSLEKDYGLEFSYASEDLKNKAITAHCKEMDLKLALETIFANNNIDFRIIDNKILLRSAAQIADIEDYSIENSFLFKGRIIDKETSKPLEFVAISIPFTSIGTSSDQFGNFELIIPSEYIADTIYLQLLGYELQRIALAANSTSANLYSLNPSPIGLQEVVLIYQKKSLEVSLVENSTYLNTSKMRNSTSSPVGDDILKTLQLLPGISAHDDVSADIKIRGSNSDETLVLLDGIPLYNSSHYYGIFSGVNSSFVDEVKLYKNTFPVNFGGKTGGMVELNSSNELSDKINGKLDINNLASSLVLDLPLGPDHMLKIGGRSTISNLSNSGFFSFTNQAGVEDMLLDSPLENLTRRILLNTDPKFNFNDWNLKWVFQSPQKHNLSFSFYHSNDLFDNSYSNSFKTRHQNNISTFTESFINREDWSNLGMNLSFTSRLSDGWNFTSRVYFTKYSNDATISLDVKRETPGKEDKMMGLNNSQYNEVEDKALDIQLNKASSPLGNIQIGTSLVHHKVDFSFQEELESILEGASNALEWNQYVGTVKTFGKRWVFDVGLRGSYYSQTKDYYLSPRVKLTHLIQNNWSLKASYSRYNQFIRELSHENRLGQNIQFWILAQNDGIDVSSSRNYMLGSTWKFDWFDIDLEFFYKDMAGVAEHALVRPGLENDNTAPAFREYRLFQGTGISKGIDLMISKQTRFYQGWVAYTLSKTTHSFEEIAGGIDFPSQDDRRHQLKLINEFQLGNFDLGINYIFSSGRPYTDLSQLVADSDRRDLQPDERIEFLPNYQRFDLSLFYNFEIKNTKAQVGASLFNALDHANVKYLQYVYSVPINNHSGSGIINRVLGSQTPLLSRTLNLNFRLSF